MPEMSIEPWMQRFMQEVYDMRKAQKDYFSVQNDHRRKVAIGKESRVDEWLKKAANAGAIKTDTPTTSQQNLFNNKP